MVTRLDRLARSTRDLLNTLAAIADRKAGFRSLGDAWADTTTSHGRLMLTVLGGLAEFERDLIRARTGEGRERAKARGVKMGRKPKLTPHQQREAIKRRESGEPMRDIARSYNVHNSTISRSARTASCRASDEAQCQMRKQIGSGKSLTTPRGTSPIPVRRSHYTQTAPSPRRTRRRPSRWFIATSTNSTPGGPTKRAASRRYHNTAKRAWSIRLRPELSRRNSSGRGGNINGSTMELKISLPTSPKKSASMSARWCRLNNADFQELNSWKV